MDNHELGDYLRDRMRKLVDELGAIDSNDNKPNDNLRKKSLIKERMSEVICAASYYGLKEYVYGQ